MCSHIPHLVIEDIIADVMKYVEKRTDDNLLGLIDKTVSGWVFEEEKVCKGRALKKNFDVSEYLQVVNYKMVASHFKISVNVAKQCLWSFKEARKDISVTYFVSGFVQERERKILLVKDEHLDYVRSRLTHIESVHIYSIESDRKDKEETSRPMDVSDEEKEEVQGKRKIQSLLSKYLVPDLSIESNKAPSRLLLPWPNTQKFYQSTLWCPCEGVDEFGLVAKKIKRSFCLSDPVMEGESGERNKSEEEIILNSSQDMTLYEVKDTDEGVNGLSESSTDDKSQLEGMKIDMFLNEASDEVKDGKDKESYSEAMFDSDDESFLNETLDRVESTHRLRDSDTDVESSRPEVEFDPDDDIFLNEALEREESNCRLANSNGKKVSERGC